MVDLSFAYDLNSKYEDVLYSLLKETSYLPSIIELFPQVNSTNP